MKSRVLFATGSRADYGIVRNYLKLMNEDENIDLRILATGALLEDEYGHQVDLIYQDGFVVDAEIKIPINSSSNVNIIHAMSIALDGFAQYFDLNKCDLLIILGDRYEMLSVATAAAMQRIPILHIHGGEATFGNYDEFIRHCITKMSTYHFAATEIYKNRIIQLGEHPDRVFNLGALGAENCTYIAMENVSDEIINWSKKNYFVILFHPETLTNVDVLSQTEELLAAIEAFPDYEFVFLGSNADTNAGIIRKRVNDYVNSNDNTKYFENLHPDAYHYLVKNAVCLVGNSSSGIIEAPSLGAYTINIGDRQKGRVRGNSVIDVECKKEQLVEAIENVLENKNNVEINNPYYQKESAKRYYAVTKELLNGTQDVEVKHFYDIKYDME